MQTKTYRIGEQKYNKYGELMEIVGYRSSRDIDVMINGEYLISHISYQEFCHRNPKSDKIKSLNQLVLEDCAKKRMGMISKASNGQTMKIVAYRSTHDINVEFDDGTVVEHKNYSNFCIGKIANPNVVSIQTSSLNEFAILYYLKPFGFNHYSGGALKEYGLGKLELDMFNPDLKIGIEYDGVAWHRSNRTNKRDANKYALCKKNGITLIRIREPELKAENADYSFCLDSSIQLNKSLEKTLKKIVKLLNINVNINFNRDKEEIYDTFYSLAANAKCVGEKKMATNGLMMEIIAYRRYKDIDVKFENGIVKQHVSYGCFSKGTIACDGIKRKSSTCKKSRVGETSMSNDGHLMKIIAYRNAMDIDVEFDDENHTIAKNRSYHNFLSGRIAMREVACECLTERIGETTLNKSGLKMTIIKYNSSNDIDVQFEDGVVVKNKTYGWFKSGKIAHPDQHKIKYEDMTNVATNGHTMTIKTWIDYAHIVVEFDNGETTTTDTKSFLKGNVALPSSKSKKGATIINKQGIKMTIDVYRTYKDIDVICENGTVLLHKSCREFFKGTLVA